MTPRRALILDTETTGLDHNVDRVVEIGMVLYSITNQTTLLQYSAIVPSISGWNDNPAVAINRISTAALSEMLSLGALPDLLDIEAALIGSSDVIVAHNAAFDQAFAPIDEKPWVCTKEDFLWPKQNKQGDSLVNLALAHGIGVSSAHRALTDCQLIARLFDVMDDLPGMFERAMRPKATFQALVSFEDKDKAKAAGFSWKGETKQWLRSMAIEDAGNLGFNVKQVSV